MAQDQTRSVETGSPKKPYNPPQVQVYGDLRQITQNKGAATQSDNPARSGTHLGNQ